jgi:type IV pilus assembly protein PilM
MFNLKEIYPIGIDITDQNIYAAQFQNTRQGMVVGHLFNHHLEAGLTDEDLSGQDLNSALRAIAKNRRFKGKIVNLHLPEKHLDCFLIAFDLGADEVLEDAIARECRRSLSYPLEEAIVDYASLVESKAKKRRYKAAIVTVRKDVVEAYLSLAHRAGLSVGVIDLHLSSLLRIHRYLFALEDAPVILCNVDDTHSLLSVVTKNSILAQRYISWGMQPILERLVSHLELSDDDGQAAGMLARYGLIHEKLASATGRPPDAKNRNQGRDMAACRTLFQLLAPYVEELIKELYQITGYIRSEIATVRFKEIAIYGWASAINFLDQYIENRLDIPTKAVNPMEKLSWQMDTPELEDNAGAPFAPALGLALRKVSWL